MIVANVHRRFALTVFIAVTGDLLAQASTDEQTAAQADEPTRGAALWLTHAESDNIGRVASSERGSYSGAGVFLDLAQETTRLESYLRTNLELRQYSDDEIDNDPVGTLDGMLRAHLVPDRFTWLLQDNYGQGLTDPFSAVSPSNRESLNTFNTGPELAIPLGGRMNLNASGLYSSRRYDESDALDSTAQIYQLGLFRQTSESTRFGLSLTSNDVEYDAVGTPAYDIDRASLSYERTFATGGVMVAAGTNEITYPGSDSQEPLYEFEWSRRVGTRSMLRIEAAQQFTDTGSILRTDVDQVPVGGETDIILSSTPFEQERLFVSYSVGGTRTNLTLSLGTAEDSYVADTGLDNDNTTTRVSFSRTVTPRLDFGIEMYRMEREFEAALGEPARKQADDTFAAWVNRSLGRSFALSLILTRYEGTGDGAGAQSFGEDRYEVRFTYSPSDSATAALGGAGR